MTKAYCFKQKYTKNRLCIRELEKRKYQVQSMMGNSKKKLKLKDSYNIIPRYNYTVLLHQVHMFLSSIDFGLKTTELGIVNFVTENSPQNSDNVDSKSLKS